MLSQNRWWYAAWLLLIAIFAGLHALHLSADFPNHSPWIADWAKYTDEGWYSNAAIRSHLFGNWYLRGDFNPAVAVPVWPFLEWILFFFTGVTVQAARGLAVAFFFANLGLSYLLLKTRGPRWMALLALTLIATSPFLYCFSRLAILEPMLTTLTLASLNLAVRLPGARRPLWIAAGIGLLFTLMMLTKTTAVFLLPALVWAMLLPLWRQRRLFWRCTLAATASFALSFGVWIALVIHAGLLADYQYLFFVNKYPKPSGFDWPLISLWWAFHGGLWVDRILIPLAGLIVLGTATSWLGATLVARSAVDRRLLLDPVFGSSVLAVFGYVLFMTVQNHPQPRYFAVPAFFCFFIVAQGAHALMGYGNVDGESTSARQGFGASRLRLLGWAMLGVAGVAVGANGAWTLDYAVHPEFTFVNAAQRLTRYINQHPNGKRMLVSVSADQIMLVTHLPALNDLFDTPSPAMPDMGAKLAFYRPGWFATWNVLDPGTLEDLHCIGSVEQVASFRAFDDPKRDVLVLFKLHPWPGGLVRDPGDENLQIRLPEDKFDIPLR
ncbi:MAG: hypothetical protein ABSF53_04100 [Terracidiphilus sp.]